MEEYQAKRFRLIYRRLEALFDTGELVFLDVEYGYLMFTSKKLHQAYGKAGSGQWMDIQDRFFFLLNFKPVEKGGASKTSLDIELFDYGYKEERDGLIAGLTGEEGVGPLDERKGYTWLWNYPLLPGKEKKAEREENTKILLSRLEEFLTILPRLERILGC